MCQKYKCTCLFYDQEGENRGLLEIKDPELLDQIKDNLNLNFNDEDEVTPFVCGTIVQGGAFVRKLRMLRCDMFSILSVCHS